MAKRRPRRFMRRMSIGVKLWTTTAILALPLIGLGIFYVQSLTDTLWFTQTEQRLAELALHFSRSQSFRSNMCEPTSCRRIAPRKNHAGWLDDLCI